jgi:hypothetical protein
VRTETGFTRHELGGDPPHHFALKDIMKAYDTFGNAAEEKVLKVILTN